MEPTLLLNRILIYRILLGLRLLKRRKMNFLNKKSSILRASRKLRVKETPVRKACFSLMIRETKTVLIFPRRYISRERFSYSDCLFRVGVFLTLWIIMRSL